ncbi:MAG: putative polymerase, sigma-24 subunit, subfamily [Microbacteriaceae bacterium]|nr:putative polymerase, sigma-24 subunit, subfamily [Microbacteriaceae bacterium]
MTIDRSTETLLRENAPLVLGALVRRYGQFAACEDATQEALIAVANQWPDAGIPDSPKAWLIAVATRRLVDEWRSESARRQREEGAVTEAGEVSDVDDSLTLLFLCCHPSLSPPSQVALTLRAVGGLTTAEIAHAFLVPVATLAQRISRAKASIRASGVGFEAPGQRAERLAVVMHVLYLIFNEGYAATSGDSADRVDLAHEAIRLARMLHRLASDDREATGLLALMLLADARRAARTDADGMLVPLAEQRRELWDADRIAEGIALLSGVLGTGPVGPYQLQAAIAAVHDEAATAGETDWPQILALYEVLGSVASGPVVTLNRAVALAEVDGPRAGLAPLGTLDADAAAALGHRLESVRANLLERAGERDAARAAYLRAARAGASRPEQHYLSAQAARLR